MRNLKNESGRTMLEMLGVLAIMGVIMYGAIAAIGFGVESYKINATYNYLEELSQGVIDLYSWSPTYPTMGDSAAKMTRAVCQNDVVECTSSKNQLQALFPNSEIRIASIEDGARFKIVHSGLSGFACGRLREMTYSNLCVVMDAVTAHCGLVNPTDYSCNDCSDGECRLVLVSR